MLAFSIVDAALVAAVSFLIWQYEQRKSIGTGDTSAVGAAQTKKDIVMGGGAEPMLTDAMEFELIKRSVALPSRADYGDDAAGYHAALKQMLDKTSALSASFAPTNPKKFDVAVPDSARTIGHTLLDMLAFKRPRLAAAPPPPIEHQDQ